MSRECSTPPADPIHWLAAPCAMHLSASQEKDLIDAVRAEHVLKPSSRLVRISSRTWFQARAEAAAFFSTSPSNVVCVQEAA